jgi:hypothetical protein
MVLAAAFEAHSEEHLLAKVLEGIRDLATDPKIFAMPSDPDRLRPHFPAWYLARGGWTAELENLIQSTEDPQEKRLLTLSSAGGQLAAGDWEGGRETLGRFFTDPNLDFEQVHERRIVFGYLQSLAGNHAELSLAVGAWKDFDDRAWALSSSVAGRAAAGDLAGTFESAGRAYRELNQYAGIGLETRMLSAAEAQERGLPAESGVYIELLEREGPAWEAGLRVDDRLLSMNERKIETGFELEKWMDEFSAGTPVFLRILRAGNGKQVTVKLGRSHEDGLHMAEALVESAKMVALAKSGDFEAALALASGIKPLEVRAIALVFFGAAMHELGNDTAKQAALDAALQMFPPDDSEETESNDFDWSDFPAEVPFALQAVGSAQLSTPIVGEKKGKTAWFARLAGVGLAGDLAQLPDNLMRLVPTEDMVWGRRPNMEIWRAEFLGRVGVKSAARLAAKSLTNKYDQDLVRDQVVLFQAAAGKLMAARSLARIIHGKKQDKESEEKTAARDAFLARLNRLAKGDERPPPVAGALSPLPLEAAKAVADPYRRARILLANAAEQRAAGDEDAAAQALALAREAAEAEDVSFYRAMAFTALAEGHLNAGDRDQAAEDLETALAVYEKPAEE